MNSDDPAQRNTLLLDRVRATIVRTRALIDQTRAAQAQTRRTLDEVKHADAAGVVARASEPSD